MNIHVTELRAAVCWYFLECGAWPKSVVVSPEFYKEIRQEAAFHSWGFTEQGQTFEGLPIEVTRQIEKFEVRPSLVKEEGSIWLKRGDGHG